MNIFGFTTLDAVTALFAVMLIGLFFGFFLGLTRYLLFAFMQHKIGWSSWGKYSGREVN
jgi:hypothetical protein